MGDRALPAGEQTGILGCLDGKWGQGALQPSQAPLPAAARLFHVARSTVAHGMAQQDRCWDTDPVWRAQPGEACWPCCHLLAQPWAR